MDNGLVLLVSMLHHVGNFIKVNRKRPQITQKDKQHVQKVWENNPLMEIFVPLLICHYNQWIGGVDAADQQIAYFMPIHHCHRNWIPMLLHILAIIRNNCYVIHKEKYGPKRDGHKLFTLSLIEDLLEKATALAAQESPRIPSSPIFKTTYPTTASQVSSPSSRGQVT
eukprot:14456903-Ditylum_brightwellii.AAC.1